MGIYIPNMEKPKDSCWECKAQYNTVCSLKREHIKFDGILDDCPLIEIDETNTELLEFYNEFKKWKASKGVAKYIRAVYGERRTDESDT